ncbi:MAG: protease [Gaiellales bacterium]|jgi:protease I|nr:protease [Gaiellales bacterium]
MPELDNKTVAILATHMVEEAELVDTRRYLDDAGAETVLVAPEAGEIQSFHDLERSFGNTYRVDATLEEAEVGAFDALFLPGGVANPDMLRINEDAVEFVREFFESGKPIGVICHGPWTLVEADVLRGRTVTSWPSLRTDIRNAGGEWVDQQVVVDQGLVSSRKPDDIPAFAAKLIEEIREGRHADRRAAGAAARNAS